RSGTLRFRHRVAGAVYVTFAPDCKTLISANSGADGPAVANGAARCRRTQAICRPRAFRPASSAGRPTLHSARLLQRTRTVVKNQLCYFFADDYLPEPSCPCLSAPIWVPGKPQICTPPLNLLGLAESPAYKRWPPSGLKCTLQIHSDAGSLLRTDRSRAF